MKLPPPRIFAAVLCTAVSSLAGTQTILALTPSAQQFGGTWEQRNILMGADIYTFHGTAILRHPDLDGDGIPDIIVGAPESNGLHQYGGGMVVAYSGEDGAELWTSTCDQFGAEFGRTLALIHDQNGDGIDDIAVGAPMYDYSSSDVDTGALMFLDATTGAVVHTWNNGQSGANMGAALCGGFDYDSNGTLDLLVGMPGADASATSLNNGYVYLFSGAPMAIVNTFAGPIAGERCGASVSDIGDIDGDGLLDFIVGAPEADSSTGARQAGKAYVLTNTLGTIARTHQGFNAYAHLGQVVDGGGDWNGDGISEYGFSAPSSGHSSFSKAGKAFLADGATGTNLYTLTGDQSDAHLGTTLRFLEDVNGDGITDLAVGGMNSGEYGFLQFHDGPSGIRMHRADGTGLVDRYGASVCVIGDLNGSGTPEVAIGVPGEEPGYLDSGNVYLMGFEECFSASATSISSSSGGSVVFDIDFLDAQSGSYYALLGSATGTGPYVVGDVAIPLTNDAFFNLFATASAPSAFSGATGVLNINGDAVAMANVPAGYLSAMVGSSYWFAAVTLTSSFTPTLSSVSVEVAVTP